MAILEVKDLEVYYGAYGRNMDTYKPSIECPNTNDKFTVSSEVGNGKLTYPVALLTADEAALAGQADSIYSFEESYLSVGYLEWLLSPSSFYNGFAFVFNLFGILDDDDVRNDTTGFRPSVSLAPGTLITAGTDGSENSPFEVFIS